MLSDKPYYIICGFLESIGYKRCGFYQLTDTSNDITYGYTMYQKIYRIGDNCRIPFQINLKKSSDKDLLVFSFMLLVGENTFNFSIQNPSIDAIDALKQRIIEAERYTISKCYFNELLKQIH